MFIQANIANIGSLSPAIALTSGSVNFLQPNSAGSCLVVDIIWQGMGPGSSHIPITVSDTNGNTYTQVYIGYEANGNIQASYVAPNCAAGLNTVTVAQTSSRVGLAVIAIHEYGNVATSSPVDAHGIQSGTTNTLTPSVTTTNPADVLHLFGASFYTDVYDLPITGPGGWFGRAATSGMSTFDLNKTATGTYSAPVTIPNLGAQTWYTAIVALKLITPESPVPAPGSAWVMIDDGPGYTDRSHYLSFSSEHETHSFSMQMRQRGNATVPLRIMDGDPYLATPTQLSNIIGVQVFLYDQTSAGAFPLFCGTVDKTETTWDGATGTRIVTLTLASFEQCYDVIYPVPQFWQNQTADLIVRQLLARYPNIPVYLGTIQQGVTVPNFSADGQTRLSELINTLATLCNFIWGVMPAGQQFYFCSPGVVAAPFVLDSTKPVLWQTWKYGLNRQDFRDRQMVKGNANAFGPSSQLFAGGGFTPQQFIVLNAVDQITSVVQTKNTQNKATGTFSGNPSPGDTITIGNILPAWLATTLYGDPSAIVDSNGHQQVIGSAYAGTQFGTSGGSPPTWNKTGGLTVDGTCVWRDLGPTLATYTFVAVIDNTQWGQVLIGPNQFITVENFIDAVNCNYATRGVAFSFPTWEHNVCNLDTFSNGYTVTVRAKTSGSSFNSSLGSACSVFSWSHSSMSGGTTAGGSVVLSSGVYGVDGSSQILYTQGSNIVVTAPFYQVPSGWSIQIQYNRVGGNVVICENTTLVQARAAIEQGTGLYQQLTSDPQNTSNAGLLQECQGALAAYSVIPEQLELQIFQPGLLPGQLLTIETIDSPTGIAEIAGSPGSPQIWVVFEISAQLIPLLPYMDTANGVPGGGHFRYSVTLINQSQVGSYLDFWEGLASGGGGGAGSGIAGAAISNGISPGGYIGATINGVPVEY